MTKPELQALARQCGMEWVNDVLCYFSYTNLQRFYEAVVAREVKPRTSIQEIVDTIPLIPLGTGYFALELKSIPEPYRTEFEQSLRGAQMPVVDGLGTCAYLVDFQRWWVFRTSKPMGVFNEA